MSDKDEISFNEQLALTYVRDIKAFYSHVIAYAVTVVCMAVYNLATQPNYLWVLWPALGWGAGVLFHGLSVYEVFNFFGPEWEKRQVEKRLNRKL